jgi:uncharacterized membrane protein
VFVPTGPNPTSGYLEIAPASRLTATDMTMDQAMTMILSGHGPDQISIVAPEVRDRVKIAFRSVRHSLA